MNISEKQSEIQLSEYTKNLNNIYYNYSSYNDKLKRMFKYASKSGSNFGIPDLIYFDNETIIIFECKRSNINQAIEDLKHYIKFIDTNYKIYSVAFVSNNFYKIFKNKEMKENTTITINKFILDISNEYVYTKNEMSLEICKINNYIRDNLHLNNDNKLLFMAVILISLKNDNFKLLLSECKSKDIFQLLIKNLEKYNIKNTIFQNLENENANKHFYEITKRVLTILNKHPDEDLLNLMYSEFMKKENNGDGKINGIVLTPPHIVKLMTELISINSDDIVLDLCTGTGSFLLEANKYNPKKLIGCEIQNNLYTLMKCNLILRDIDNFETFNSSCFDNNYTATKSIINPPYGSNKLCELNFVIKQLKSLRKGYNSGIAISIIPCSKLNNNKKFNKLKKEIIENYNVKAIIKCNKDLFMPHASPECCILIVENTYNENNKTMILNYEDDGLFSIRHHGKKQNNNFQELYNNIIKQYNNNENLIKLKYDEDWLNKSIENKASIDLTNYKLQELTKKYEEECMRIKNSNNIIIYKNYKEFNLTELFIIETKKSKILVNQINLNTGIYPYISAKKKNGGIVGYVNEYLYDKHCISVAKNGSVGACFYRDSKFTICGDVIVLIPKIDFTKDELIKMSMILTTLFTKQFNYNYKLSVSRLNKFKINLPINELKKINLDVIK